MASVRVYTSCMMQELTLKLVAYRLSVKYIILGIYEPVNIVRFLLKFCFDKLKNTLKILNFNINIQNQRTPKIL